MPAVEISDRDPAETRGQLVATRLVLQEALGRLADEQLAQLNSGLGMLVDQLRAEHGDDIAADQAHIIDEIEAISLRLGYRDQPIEHPDDDFDGGERVYVGVCMRCEHFPIDAGASCPQCGTGRWVTMVRS